MISEVKQVGFQPGNKLGKGRPPKLKTQVKDFIKEHPYAVETLMLTLYEMGIKGDREAAMYIIDRVKGKPKSQTDINIEGMETLGASTVMQIFKLVDERRLQSLPEPAIMIEGGDDAI